MGSFWCGPLVAVFAFACSGSPAKKTADTGGGTSTEPGGEAAASCEAGRCLDDIKKVVQENRPAARACYDDVVKKKPGIAGLLVINFEIDPEGAVADVSQGMQDNQISDADVVDCVAGVIKNIKFAKSAARKTTRAYHRFEFNPK